MKRQRILTRGPFLSTLAHALTPAPQSSSAGTAGRYDLPPQENRTGRGQPRRRGEDLVPRAGEWPTLGLGRSERSELLHARGRLRPAGGLPLLDWPPANGVHVELDVATIACSRLNECGDPLVAWFRPGSRIIMYADLTGSLRLVREGGTIAGDYRSAGCWVEIGRYGFDNPPGFARLQVGTESSRFAGQPVLEAFDNFRISRGRLECP